MIRISEPPTESVAAYKYVLIWQDAKTHTACFLVPWDFRHHFCQAMVLGELPDAKRWALAASSVRMERHKTRTDYGVARVHYTQEL